MLCPRCGAYSPYNTSACNRCGAKLNGEVTGEQPRKRKYYRNARKSEWEQARERLLTKANDTLDGIMADSRKRMILFAAAAALLVVTIVRTVNFKKRMKHYAILPILPVIGYMTDKQFIVFAIAAVLFVGALVYFLVSLFSQKKSSTG